MRKGVKTSLKIVLWVVLAIVLFVAGTLIATVQVMTPERLTPLTVQVANRVLNADVKVDKVELSLRESFPFLNIDIDEMVILSRDIKKLPEAARDTLPQWCDTLIDIKRLHGGINIFRLSRGIIDLKDLQIYEPKVNLLVVNDSLNNFSITLPSTDEKDTTSLEVPDISLNHFSLINPRPIKYADVAQRTFMTASIQSAELTNSSDSRSSNYLPLYRIEFDSNISSPLLHIIGQTHLPVGFDGIVEWNHNYPYRLGLKDFCFAVSKLSGMVNTELDFENQLTANSFDFSFNPLSVAEFLDMVPDSLAKKYYIPKDMVTDANVVFKGKLSEAYVLGSETLPVAQMNFTVPPCHLKYDKIELNRIHLNADILLNGGTPNDAHLIVNTLELEGPATSLIVKGRISEMTTDPLFEGDIDGSTNLDKLPSLLTNKIPAKIKGCINANTTIICRPSMFSRDNFHKLRIAGDLSVDKFLYLSDDTLTMYSANRADLHFGTHERFANGQGVVTDSLLTAKLSVDTTNILVSGLDIKGSRLKLGVGALNQKASTDTTLVIPMGGRLSLGTFSLFSISDSAGLRIRGIDGRVSMRRFKGDAHLPLFSLNLGLNHLSTGDNSTRFMVNKGIINCSLAKLPETEGSKRRREVKHIADSLHRHHPDLPIDSVYRIAVEIRNRNRHPGHHRVHSEITSHDNEIIEWGTSTAMRRLLLDWDVNGSLSASTARLFTTSFPIRNRVENLNIAFNNDSIALENVQYKVGNSDFLISGNITNMKRALTARRNPSPLRINFNLLSDFIDVNELSHALMTGSANKDKSIANEPDDENALERELEAHRNDSIAPLLIPTNVDAELVVSAKSVAYSDFVMHNFKGTVLMYDGAVNLHNLTASSEVGAIDLTALYSAPTADSINFGFGMKLDRFNISNFLKLVPAVDSIMPMLHDLSGIINANLALTSDINHNMDLVFPSIKAAINLKGDSISFIDEVTFNKVAKWLLFRNKEKNMIDHISAEMIVENGEMRLFPFIFDFDRYKLGVQGHNDFDMNFNYHIAVLKSPIPFKFGINIKGNYDKLKIRLGGAKFNERTTLDRSPLVNDTRINLINQFQNVFRRGVRNSKFATVEISDKPLAVDIDLDNDTLTTADSLYFKEQGLIP